MHFLVVNPVLPEQHHQNELSRPSVSIGAIWETQTQLTLQQNKRYQDLFETLVLFQAVKLLSQHSVQCLSIRPGAPEQSMLPQRVLKNR